MNKIERALAKFQRDRAAAGAAPQVLGRVIEQTAPPEPKTTEQRPTAPREVRWQYRNDRQIRVDLQALRRVGLLAPETQERKLAEEYRQIKRPLLANAVGRGVQLPRANLLMVGSALPGEGKTFTCINLCLSLALEKDWSVVLVDGDVARAHLTELFGLRDEPGLMELLREENTRFDDFVLRTDVPGLSILPAGRIQEHPAELMASARMDYIAQQLDEEGSRRMIVFDSSPLLVTTEAVALAAHIGQIVLVVYAGHTPQLCVQQAISKLDPQKAINLVLNMAELGDEATAYGGAYGYGYGHGYSQGGAGRDAQP